MIFEKYPNWASTYSVERPFEEKVTRRESWEIGLYAQRNMNIFRVLVFCVYVTTHRFFFLMHVYVSSLSLLYPSSAWKTKQIISIYMTISENTRHLNLIVLFFFTFTVFPSQASVTSQRASRCSNEDSTPVKFAGWLFQRRQKNCWSIEVWLPVYLKWKRNGKMNENQIYIN